MVDKKNKSFNDCNWTISIPYYRVLFTTLLCAAENIKQCLADIFEKNLNFALNVLLNKVFFSKLIKQAFTKKIQSTFMAELKKKFKIWDHI